MASSDLDCAKGFGAAVKDRQKIWKILKSRTYITGFATAFANHVMGARRCSWASEFDVVAPIMGCRAAAHTLRDIQIGQQAITYWACDGRSKESAGCTGYLGYGPMQRRERGAREFGLWPQFACLQTLFVFSG